MNILTPVDAAWLSGFFDGEGYIGTHNSGDNGGTGLRVLIGQKFPTVLYRVETLLGYGSVGEHANGLTYRWTTRKNTEIKHFIETILPYSIVKQPQLEAGLEYLSLCPGSGYDLTDYQRTRRQELVKILQQLKKEDVT